jgi:lipopolysaccharide biosynthesis regulator YciM
MNPQLILFLLLPIATFSGWYFGSRGKSRVKENKSFHFSRNYFKGLNFLLNEQPDKAVDIFIKMIEIDNDTVDTYLAIGSLFRRRGEVDRAIRIHQNLIARPNLKKYHRIQALIALGQDYLNAGVYDRAERLFLEAEDISGVPNPIAYKNLLLIYQQEKEWYKAIDYANKLTHIGDEKINQSLANYYCELIEDKRENFSVTQKLELLKKALKINPKSVRASLLEGALLTQLQRYNDAINAYTRVKSQNICFLVETIEPIAICYEQLNKKTAMIDYLNQCLAESPRLDIILVMADKLSLWHGEKVAIRFLTEKLQQCSSVAGIERLMNLYQKANFFVSNNEFNVLHRLMKKLLHETAGYQCEHCGFLSKLLQWLCPGCQRWNTTKPLTTHIEFKKEV